MAHTRMRVITGKALWAILFIVAQLSTFTNAATVSHISTTDERSDDRQEGSTEGGTLLRVLGTGFAENHFSMVPSKESSNSIKLVNGNNVYDCPMQNEKSSEVQLACYTPKLPAADYQVQVSVEGNDIPIGQYSSAAAATFSAKQNNTPQITSISPMSGEPQRLITLSGDFKTGCYLRDSPECSSKNVSAISRIYFGTQLCNLINDDINDYYSNLNKTQLQCRFESNEVGIFNVSMLVSNEYGRSSVDTSLYRMSGTGQVYNVETYAVLANVSSNRGSTEGGTILKLTGNYFIQSDKNPLVVNVGDNPCTISSANLTTIICQTPIRPVNNRQYFRGGRGLRIYYQPGVVNLNNLGNATPPMPNVNATRIWTGEASFSYTFSSANTVWFQGYIRAPMEAAFFFRLDTNAQAALFLSTNEDPANMINIANSANPYSQRFVLQNNKDYYLLCIGSISGGNFRMAIQSAMQPLNTRTAASPPGVSEVQQINIGGNVTSEHQRIIYMTNSSVTGVSEVQDVEAVFELFQIGFRGVYTGLLDGPPPTQDVQDALNDLPTIYPLSVTVALVGTAYRVTFPVEMGDVPLLTTISTAYMQPRNATEITQGVSPASAIAFQLEGATTSYFDFRNSIITPAMLTDEFTNLFNIRCPSSFFHTQTASSIVYTNEFEQPSSYDDTFVIENMAFCGRSALGNSSQLVVSGNTQEADYMCFAYKIIAGGSITMNFQVTSDGNPPNTETIPMSNLIADSRWHYQCISIRNMFEQYSSIYQTVTSIVINQVDLPYFVPLTIMIDTVTLRNDLPLGFEDDFTVLNTDKSSTGPCNFPFTYNGKNYSTCVLDENNLPICGFNNSIKIYCQNSSIEGVRRLFPKYQLLDNSLQITHSQPNGIIDVSFRYTSCMSPSLIKILPPTAGQVISISNASKGLSGSYSIMFDGQIYPPIPTAIAQSNLADLLQSFRNFGYVSVSRTGQCHQYSYTIQWLVNGEQPLITIANSTQIQPTNAPISVTSVRRGSSTNVFYNLPNDILRTYHTTPQVEVVVGGFPSLCSNTDNNCEFQSAISNTPTITSVTQNGTTVTIIGTGFSSQPESNKVSIGDSGSCDIQTATTTLIRCVIINAPSGQYPLRLNVADKGLASANATFMVQVPLTITSFAPNGGDSGGGYNLTIWGSGFSPRSVVTLGENFCMNRTVVNYTTIKCIVPPSGSGSLIQVRVTVFDGLNSTIASTQFTYNVTVAPTIYSIYPTFVTMLGGSLSINGTGFGNQGVSVFINMKSVPVLTSSNNYIKVNLITLPPGLYPITVNTPNGFARPLFQIEYRFYVQQLLPQVGSAYGGNDVYVSGAGFENGTTVQFRDENNDVSACNIVLVQSDLIHCQTTPTSHQLNITSYGSHPTYGFGYAWLPSYETIQQGTTVTWYWDSSQLYTPAYYKVQQVDSPYGTQAVQNGFDSGQATTSGSFSYQFNDVGTFYYWAPNITQNNGYSMRGVIEVIALKSAAMTAEVTWNKFTAQTCAFPFIFNSINYTSCTSVNDTRLWCSPSPIYTGYRIYCTPTASIPTSSCSWTTLNVGICNQTVPTSSNPTQYLSTICSIETITAMSPSVGSVGTLLTITGTYFGGNICDYDIQIGPSYHCPIINMSSTTLTCQITPNSTLDARTSQNVRVARYRQGYLSSQTPLQFSFLPSISNISPMIGSIYGGTRVTIDGDGFLPEYTLVYIVGANYTFVGCDSFSRITFTTPPELTFYDLDLTTLVYVQRTQALCLMPSCHFTWATSATSYFDSVSPLSIRGNTNLSITGRNLLSGGGIPANAHVSIGESICNITLLRNNSIQCVVNGTKAGVHDIVGSIDGVGNIGSSVNISSEAYLSTITPLINSVYGGATLSIDGHGFSSNASEVHVNVGSNPCPITEATESRVQCTVPPRNNSSTAVNINITSHEISFPSSFVLTYNNTITPNITGVSPSIGSNSQNLIISGDKFASSGQASVKVGNTDCSVSSRSMATIACTVSSNLPAGHHEVVVHVEGVGDSNSDVSYTQDLSITNVTPSQGGYGGGLSSVISGNGFNGTNVTVNICNRACLSKEIASNAQLICVTPDQPMTAASNSCNLTVSVDGITKSTVFTYRANLTATVTSVSPNRGGTGGGTTITINGTNFPTSINSVTVTIAGIQCSIKTISTTSIVCETGMYPYSSVQAPVMVHINGSGNAISSAQFQYIDMWSSPWTWGGSDPPEAGTLVVIDNHVTIYLDIETPILKVLVIDGATLIFDDSQDVALNVEYIVIVNGGCLQVGTESQPFQHRGVITMYGHLRSIELPIFGAKVLALREGVLDMHGLPTVRTWTQLAATAMNGSTTLTLLQPVNWTVNSQIVIATTSDRFSQKESEVRQITNISQNGLILTLDQPLTYTHLGMAQTLNSTTVQIRAEVGLLTHNVVFQGSITATWNDTIEPCPAGFNPDEFAVQTCYLGRYGQEIGSDQFGATIMGSQGNNTNSSRQAIIVRLSNVELYNVGQAFRLDRYPIHFRSNGNMSQSYVKSSSVHLSFNRAVHIQASNYITIENNVIYNIMGNAMFLSDGIEVGHSFRGNLAVFVKASSSLLNEDLTPAAFWLSNPNNIVEFNAVAGATHYGYWYRFSDKPEGLSLLTMPDYCPNRQPFGRFYNNSVHSTGRFGVWVYPEYAPTVSGGCNDTQPIQAVFDGLISWKNNKGIETVMSRTIQIKNALVFDNADMGIACITAVGHQETNPPDLRQTFYDIHSGSSVVDSIIIGDVGISANPVVPNTAGLVVMWDRGLAVSNVVFINFPSNATRAIFGPIILDRCTNLCGGWPTKFSNLSFINVLIRGKFRWEYDAIYYDEDGTLGGQPNSVIMAPDGLTNGSTVCTSVSHFENAIQCPLSQGSWLHVSLRDILERSQGRLFIFDAANTSSTIVNWLQEQLTFPNGYMTVLRANQTFTFQFEVLSDARYLRYNGVIYDVAPGDYLIIQHPLSVAPYRANTTANRTMILGSPMPLSGVASNNGDWYYDNAASLFSYIVKNPSTANTSIDIELSFQVYICPCNACACPPPPTTTTTTATTATTTTATTATTTSATTTTTTSATTTTTTSATTTTTTSATTTTSTSATTTTTTTTTTSSATTATTTTTTSTIYLPPIQPCTELPTNQQVCQYVETKYWSIDWHWTFGPQDYPNWMGTKPGNGNNIFVPRCIWLIIDYPLPSIRALRIDGVVEFQQGLNHVMSVDTIIINGGRLVAGLPNIPFNGSVDIIMTNSGQPTIQWPQIFPPIGTKLIAVFGGLDLHGIPRGISWTRLATTASSGQNIITLRQSVSWRIGDEIIITTTDTSISHTERHRIANIQNGTVIYTVAPLAYTHIVMQQRFANGQTVSISAAVGLLTHNVRVINQNSGSALSGYRIWVGSYRTPIWHIQTNAYYDTCYKGYARLSDTQFIGFGRLDDSYLADQRSAVYLDNLGYYDPLRPTYINSCSFDSGFNAAVGMLNTNGISITNNIVYNTYRSGLVLTGTNNIVQNNLVASVYWVGTGQLPSVAQFSLNNDGAIMTRDVISVRLLDNLVVGAERLAYRIQGETCGSPDIYVPSNITNEYSNNEAHSVMSGVNLWPSDKGFTYDRKCVLIKGFSIYKAWYYAFYINTPRNITINSSSSIDSYVGIFTYIIGPSALTHVPVASRVNIINSLVVGSITPQDCADKISPNSINIQLAQVALPGISPNQSVAGTGGRAGIVFPTVSRNNYMPNRAWTGVGTYPCLSGLMTITNTTLAFFNDTCNRHDVAIQVSQTNDDGQFPITTRSLFVYNTSDNNLIFNGLPNLGVVNPSRCGDMDCDGLKKALIVDTDGSLFGQPASVFSNSEALWGNQQHGIGDYRIPREALTNLTGQRININLTYPYRGISRSNSCSLQSSWGMYKCNMTTNYVMLIIESMDSDTEKRRISPVAIMSNSGYIDLINGPADRTFCNGYACRKRISTFMAIVQSGQTYSIFFSSNPPKQTRFRLLNADSSIKCVLALHYFSTQQVDVFANTLYMPPTNRDLRSTGIMLLDQPNNVSILSPPGSNYFDRTYRMTYFAIDGNNTIDLRISPLLILSFGFPPMDPSSFFSTNLVNNLAALLNISPDKIRRVNIISAANSTRIRRQSISSSVPYRVEIEMRDEPRSSTTASTGIRAEILSNIASAIINRYQIGELQIAWLNAGLTNNTYPSVLSSQEPFDDFQVELSVVSQLVLVTPPSDCRQQSPCTIQPVLVAYDVQGNVIQKLGSNDRPWQVKASLVGQPNVNLMGSIANYTNGQTQYTLLALPDNGTQQVQFSLIQPDGVNTSFFIAANLTVRTAFVPVTKASLAGRQVNNIYVVNVNGSFSVSVTPIDGVTRLKLAQIQWGGWQWIANVSLYTLPQYQPQGALIQSNVSRTIINLSAGTVTVTNLSINATGMYVLKVEMTSSNNEHYFVVKSNGILVKNASGNFVNDPDSYSSNITYDGDFDTLNTTDQLEVKRSVIYNYLRSIGLPLMSDIVALKGSVVALFEIELIATDASNAVSTILSNLGAVSDLTVRTLSINSRTYEIPDTSNGNSTNNSTGTNTALIVGLTVSLGSVTVVTIGAIVAYQVHAKMLAQQRLGPSPNEVANAQQNSPTSVNVENCEKIEHPPVMNNPTVTKPVHFTKIFNPQMPQATNISPEMELIHLN